MTGQPSVRRAAHSGGMTFRRCRRDCQNAITAPRSNPMTAAVMTVPLVSDPRGPEDVGGAVAVGEALVVCEPGDGDSGSAGAGVPATVKLTEPDTGWPSSDTTRYPIV